MRRCAIVGLTAALVLVFVATGSAWADGPEERRSTGLSPWGAFSVTGPIFEEVRSVSSVEGADRLEAAKISQDDSMSGRFVSTIRFTYESQPPELLIFDTAENPPPPVVYMAEQLQPKIQNAWIRIDFSVLAAVWPAPDEAVGLAYALYVKEDGGDRTIDNPGEVTCGGDDTCGYLDQTYDAPWLITSSNGYATASAARSDFFRAYRKRMVEVQVHLYPVHEDGGPPAHAGAKFGTLILSSGK